MMERKDSEFGYKKMLSGLRLAGTIQLKSCF
jgi:hypothetical protein